MIRKAIEFDAGNGLVVRVPDHDLAWCIPGTKDLYPVDLVVYHTRLGASLTGPRILERIETGIRSCGVYFILTGHDIGGNAVINGDGIEPLFTKPSLEFDLDYWMRRWM